jgi:hypothetical protein
MNLIILPIALLVIAGSLIVAWRRGNLEKLLKELPEIKFILGGLGGFPICGLLMLSVVNTNFVDTKFGVFLMFFSCIVAMLGFSVLTVKFLNHRQAIFFALTGLGITVTAIVVTIWYFMKALNMEI